LSRIRPKNYLFITIGALVVAEAEALARSEEFDPYQMLGEHYTSMRRWTPAFLATFTLPGRAGRSLAAAGHRHAV
jgi:hypothetical protein